MKTFIEVLDKAADKIKFGWKPEDPYGISGYNVYVGQVAVPASMIQIVGNVAPQPSNEPGSYKKVVTFVSAADVQTALSLPATSDFSNLVLYFAITYIDMSLSESSLSDSTIVEVPPVGIMGKTMREDPTQNRHIYGFSDELQRWIKVAGTGSGAIITDVNDMYKANITTEYTRDSTGNVLTEKAYFSDRTTSGSPAKLITYDYLGGYVSKVTITDSTV